MSTVLKFELFLLLSYLYTNLLSQVKVTIEFLSHWKKKNRGKAKAIYDNWLEKSLIILSTIVLGNQRKS